MGGGLRALPPTTTPFKIALQRHYQMFYVIKVARALPLAFKIPVSWKSSQFRTFNRLAKVKKNPHTISKAR